MSKKRCSAAAARTSVSDSREPEPRHAEPPKWTRRVGYRLLRIFRFEEGVILGLLVVLVVTYVSISDAPPLAHLAELMELQFYGGGAMWRFLLWCVAGTVVILVIALVPFARKEGVSRVLRGVWGEARGVRPRLVATTRWGLGGLRVYVPFLACMGVYEMNKQLVPAVRGETIYDLQLAKFEYWAFGDLTAVIVHNWMHAPWVTEAISWIGVTQSDIHGVTYMSYVFAAPALALALWFLGRRQHFDRFIGALVIAGALAYVGYVLVPVVGPKYVFGGPDRWLVAGPEALRFMEDVKGGSRDCFPSLHTAWTSLFLFASFRGAWVLFWLYLPIAVGVYVSTLYGGYHYLVDIIAGHLLAMFAWWAAPPLRAWWDRRRYGAAAKVGSR